MERLKVGLAGTYQLNFQGPKQEVWQRALMEMEQLSREKGFDFFPIRDGLLTEADAQRARRELDANDVDFTLIQTSSFSDGNIILPLAKLRGRFGLWAIPETSHSGPLPLNSFCGVNMYSSIIGQYLDQDKSFKWFYGWTGDDLFTPRLEVTLRTLAAIKNLRQAKVGLVGGIAPGFNDLYYDERKIEQRFGTRIYRLNEFDEIVQGAKAASQSEVDAIVRFIKEEAVEVKVSDARIERAARAYLGLKKIATDNGYEALAVSCWPKFQSQYELVVCNSLARLGEEGIPAACEGDAISAMCMLLLNYLNQDRSTVLDLSDFDEKDQTVLMFHCGPSPKRWANARGIKLDVHSVLGIERPGQPIQRADLGVVNDMVFRDTPATFFRLTWDGDYMALFTGDSGHPDKPGFDGSRGWFGNLKWNGEPISVRDLINTIMVTRFQHHYPTAFGDLTDELMEFAAWTGVQPLEKVPYQRYLQ